MLGSRSMRSITRDSWAVPVISSVATKVAMFLLVVTSTRLMLMPSAATTAAMSRCRPDPIVSGDLDRDRVGALAVAHDHFDQPLRFLAVQNIGAIALMDRGPRVRV